MTDARVWARHRYHDGYDPVMTLHDEMYPPCEDDDLIVYCDAVDDHYGPDGPPSYDGRDEQ